MDLRSRLELGGQSLLAIPDPDKDLMPTGGYEVAHDTGRWWDAVLRLESATGFAIPADLESAMLGNLKTLTDNLDGLLMNNPDVPWLADQVRINPHNFREAMIAFGALVRFRASRWARQAGHRLLETMDRCLEPDGRFDFTKLACWGHVPHTTDPSHTEQPPTGWFDGTATSGRSLEAIVWFYEATGDALALTVADRIARHHLAHTTTPDGSMRPEVIDHNNVGHDHSYQGTLRGLLLYGLLTGQRAYVDTVAATYRDALPHHVITESGWAPHDLGKMRFPNALGDPVADPASAGDTTQLALWLALRAGHGDLLDDVERLVRSRLIPAQMTEADVHAHPDLEVRARDMGSWSIHAFPHAGKGCTPDVACAVVHTLCDVYRHIVTESPLALCVNLHLDRDDPRVRVRSQRDDQATVTVSPSTPRNTFIRVPGWTPPDSVRLTVDGRPIAPTRVGPYAFVSGECLGHRSEIVLHYALPERVTEEPMPSGRVYRFRWKGDRIVGASPDDAPWPFYPTWTDG